MVWPGPDLEYGVSGQGGGYKARGQFVHLSLTHCSN